MSEAVDASPRGTARGLPELLYDGEEGIAATEAAGVTIAVTSHRLLIHAPGGTANGARFREVHRPNVLGIDVTAAGGGTHTALALRLGLYAVILLAAGALIDFDGLLDSIASPDAPGMGGVIAVIRTITSLLTLVDDALLALGGLVGIAALVLAGLALGDRGRYLEIRVAGADPVRIPVGRHDDVDGAIARIESALETG